MKNANSWVPTKFIRADDGKLLASRNPAEVTVTSRLMADLIAEWYDENLKAFATGDLLDLGCGKAPLYGTYSSLVTSSTLADWANSLHENTHLDVVCDITKRLPFKDNSFDTILFSDVLEHIPNPAEVLAEIGRILRPDGVVLMNVPFLYWVHEAPHDYHRYTEYMLAKLAEDADFRIEKIEALAGGWAVLIDLSSKLLCGRPKLVRMIQKFGPKLLNSRLKIRSELPLAYAMVLRKEPSK